MKLFVVFLSLLVIMPLAAQEESLPEWDFGALFDVSPPEPPSTELGAAEEFSPMAMLRQPGFTFDGTFEFVMGLVPGWQTTPWFSPPYPNEDRDFSWEPAARMRVRFDIDTQISEILRVRSSVFFIMPGYQIELRDFFFDYSLFDRFFFRGGRFNQAWGISPNFAFTNLLARVPDDSYTDDPFILRANIPIGIGGLQFLALTRVDLFDGDPVHGHDVGYGAKFNLALRWADIDIGAFYQDRMPFRGFVSFKTTIGRTEWYNEWLGAFDAGHLPRDVTMSGAVNLGFVRNFIRNRLTINGELFFNTEERAYWFRPETNISDAESLPFNDGFNIAFNVIYRFRGRTGPRLFVQTLFAPWEGSAQVIPGFRLTPWEHLELYFAVPMSLGNKDGHYYQNTADPVGNRPFTVVMLLTLRGGVRIGQNH